MIYHDINNDSCGIHKRQQVKHRVIMSLVLQKLALMLKAQAVWHDGILPRFRNSRSYFFIFRIP